MQLPTVYLLTVFATLALATSGTADSTTKATSHNGGHGRHSGRHGGRHTVHAAGQQLHNLRPVRHGSRQQEAIVKVPLQYVDSPILGSTWLATVQAGKSVLNVTVDAQFTDFIVNAGTYIPRASPSSEQTQTTFKVARDDEDIAVGTLYADTFSIGSLTLKEFPIGVGQNKWYNRGPSNGLLGFAYRWQSEVNGKDAPFLWELKQAGAIAENVMGLALWKEPGAASLSIGGVDRSKFKGGMEWVAIPDGYPFWSSPAKLGGVDAVLTLDSTRWTIDAPIAMVEQIFKANPGYTTYTEKHGILRASVDCAHPPELLVQFGHIKVPVAGMTDVKLPNGRCVVPLAGVSKEALPSGDVMFGGAGLANLYAVVNMDKGAVGYGVRA